VPETVVQTGKAWAEEVEKKLAAMKAEAPVKKTDASKPSTKKPDMSPWTYTLTPVCSAGAAGEPVIFPPETGVLLPSPGAPIGLEWWHFQMNSVINSGKFVPLVCELGWTEEALLNEPVKAFHFRRGIGYPEEAKTDFAG
jgi:hypothetical protein